MRPPSSYLRQDDRVTSESRKIPRRVSAAATLRGRARPRSRMYVIGRKSERLVSSRRCATRGPTRRDPVSRCTAGLLRNLARRRVPLCKRAADETERAPPVTRTPLFTSDDRAGGIFVGHIYVFIISACAFEPARRTWIDFSKSARDLSPGYGQRERERERKPRACAPNPKFARNSLV